MKLSDHLGKGIWGVADKGLPVLYGIGYVALVIRVLPEVELGNFALVQTIFLFVTGLANGFPLQPLLKFASEERDDKKELVSTAFFLNLLFILIVSIAVLAARYLVASILNAPALENLLLLVPAMLFASFFRNFSLVLLQTRYRIRQIFWTDAAHFIGAILLVYVWSKLQRFDSAYDLVYINLISLGTSSVVGLIFCRKLLTVSWRPSVQHIKMFWEYGKFVLGGILSYLFYSNADYFFISAFAGPAQVGVYNAVKTFVRIYDTMQQVIQMFILPGTSRLSSIGDMRSLKVLTEKAICFGTLALLPIFLLFALFAYPLMDVISAGRFVGAAPLLQLFGLLSFLTAANAVSSNVLLGLGHAREGFYLSVMLLVSSALFYAVFVPVWGALGATIGFLASSALLTWLTVRKVQQFVPFTFKEVVVRVNDATQFVKTRLRRALMALPTTTRQCEACGSDDLRHVYTARDKNRQVDERRFEVMKCEDCGVGFTLPTLSVEELSPYYPREYYSIESNLALEAATRPYNQLRSERIQRFVSKGRLLDIGAGTGMFLKTAKDNGFEVEGLEISADAADFGRTTWSLNIRQGNLLETALASNHYDVVTLGHVYEHLHEPREAAKQIHSALKQGGLLVIAVPNFDSIQAKLFRSHWFHLDVPRHLFHYSPSGLKRLIESVGFNVVNINFFSAEHNWAGILGSVMKLSRPGESFAHKLIRKTIGMPLARSLAFLESAIGRGGTFELYAQKQ